MLGLKELSWKMNFPFDLKYFFYIYLSIHCNKILEAERRETFASIKTT